MQRLSLSRQAARAIGGLRERLKRCKPGSTGHAHYLKRIEAFEQQEWRAADTLDAILTEAVTAHETRS